MIEMLSAIRSTSLDDLHPLLPRQPAPELEELRDLARQAFDPDTEETENLVSAQYEELVNANYLALDVTAVSPVSKGLIESILSLCRQTPGWKEPQKRQRESIAKLKAALAAVIGHLLIAAARRRSFGSNEENVEKAGIKSDWMFRSLDRRTFKGTDVSREKFEDSVEILTDLQLIEIKQGYWHPTAKQGYTKRYRARRRLIDEAVKYGLTSANLRDHFKREPVVEPLVLKSFRGKTEKAKGFSRRVPIHDDDQLAKALREEVEVVNDLVRRSEITGSDLRGFQRVFNLGDREGHDWRFGGRVFAVSADDRSYQLMKEEERLRLLINGEPVVELDIGSCYLTIALGRCGAEVADFSGDLYARVAGVPREVIKAWLTCFFGKQGPLVNWPKATRSRLQTKFKIDLRQHRIKSVRDRIFEAFPELVDWESRGLSVYELMETESDVVFGTVVEFARKGTLLLPVHDGLLAPIHIENDVKSTLVRRFRNRVPGVTPRITGTMAEVDEMACA